MAAPLPLAAGFDWIEGVLPFLFLLVWIVSQVRNLFVGAGKPAEKVVVLPRRGPPVADEGHRELSRQIEEFMRRQQGGPPTAPPSEPRRAAPPLPPRGRVAASKRPATPPPVEPARPLGSLGGHATDVARHVEDAFARDLEHRPAGLAQPAGAAAPPIAASTADLMALLRAPATLRQLVVIREVLDRPVDRW